MTYCDFSKTDGTECTRVASFRRIVHNGGERYACSECALRLRWSIMVGVSKM